MRIAVVVAAVLVCAATSPPRYPRNYPRWGMTQGADQRVGCAVATAWVSKSGKTGVGVSAIVRDTRAIATSPGAASAPPAIATSPDETAAAPAIATSPDETAAADGPGCRFEVIDARLVLADGATVAASPASIATDGAPRDVSTHAVVIRPGGEARLYLPFAFDNNAMWNRGVRAGTFELIVSAGGERARWRIPAEHVLDGFHADRRGGRDNPRRYSPHVR